MGGEGLVRVLFFVSFEPEHGIDCLQKRRAYMERAYPYILLTDTRQGCGHFVTPGHVAGFGTDYAYDMAGTQQMGVRQKIKENYKFHKISRLTMNLKPLADRVIIQPAAAEEVTSGRYHNS